jgi:hypothetical protein
MLRFRELLTKVWAPACFSLPGVRVVRMNCCLWFGFGGATVLVGWRGDQVSCYTTVGDICLIYRTEKLDIDKVSICSNSSYTDF